MNKTDKLFYEAMNIIERDDWKEFVVGCHDFSYGVKTFTSAIEKAKDRISLAKTLEKCTGKSKAEEIEKLEKIISILEKSKKCMAKKRAVEKEISKRLNAYAEEIASQPFNYFELCRNTDRIRKEVESEFYA